MVYGEGVGASGPDRPRVEARVHAALLLVQLGFGGFHVVAKAVLGTLHPLQLAGLRVAVATPLLLALAWRLERRAPARRDLPHLALLGLLGIFANQLLFILGLDLTTATSASVLMPSIPVFAAGAAVALGLERYTPRRAAGVALAVAGSLAMVGPAGLELGSAAALGDLLVLANCLSYALFLVLQRPLLGRLGALTVIAWSFLFGGAGVAAVTAPWLLHLEPGAWSPRLWAGLAYIVLIPTALNYALNTWAVSRSTPSLVATYTTLQPLAAATLAALFLGERPGWPHALGGALIVAGLALVSRTAPAPLPGGAELCYPPPPWRGTRSRSR